MSDTILKITKSGSNVWGDNFSDVLMHSDYSMFKYHMDKESSMTINAGETTKTISFAHGLGYTPTFISYLDIGGAITPLPRRDTTVALSRSFFAYADDTNIYIKYYSDTPYNQETVYVNDAYIDVGYNGFIGVGQWDGTSWNSGYRFSSVSVAKNASISSATVDFSINVKDGSDNLLIKTWGIDEDNVGEFGDDLGKAKTDAYTEQTVSAPDDSYFGINVTSIVQEITSRSGWVSGNAMGFYTFDNGTPNNNTILDVLFSSNDTYLKIILNGSVTYSFRTIVFKDRIV
jgi:hypothetical protein